MSLPENIYSKILTYARQQSYSLSQIQNLTHTQFKTFAQNHGVTDQRIVKFLPFFEQIKSRLIEDFETDALKSEGQQIKQAILARFPDAEFDIDRKKSLVMVWLKGRPAAEEVV
ncbi:MAG: hypothetical protein OEV87_00745 [Phycisphaerae bacterium]|nr:hypothetical protein [Phycisphaerae bacterium]